MSEWQPIDTAPKDGTRVLLLRRGYAEACAVGYWDRDSEQWSVVCGGHPFIGTLEWRHLPPLHGAA